MLTYKTNIKTVKPNPPDFWIIRTEPPYIVQEVQSGAYGYLSGEQLNALKLKYKWAVYEPKIEDALS